LVERGAPGDVARDVRRIDAVHADLVARRLAAGLRSALARRGAARRRADPAAGVEACEEDVGGDGPAGIVAAVAVVLVARLAAIAIDVAEGTTARRRRRRSLCFFDGRRR